MTREAIVVDAVRDDEAGVWVATSDDIGGLAVEAATFEELAAKVVAAVADLVELNGLPDKAADGDAPPRRAYRSKSAPGKARASLSPATDPSWPATTAT